MDEFNVNSCKYFSLFVMEFNEYKCLFMNWEFACLMGNTKDELRLAKVLFHKMRVNGWA